MMRSNPHAFGVDAIAGAIFARHPHQILFPILFPERVTLIEQDRETFGKRRRTEAARCARAIEEAASRRISAANFLETAVVIDGSRDPVASRRFDDLLREAEVAIEPVTEAQARAAREAYRDFGKGSGHPAQLNFGDCCAYAFAKVAGESLLFKGDDFRHTDVVPALKLN